MISILHKKILSRGYWRVIIRPTKFEEKYIPNIASLYPILEKNQVRIRGWAFPPLNYKEPYEIKLDWIGQEYEWEHYKFIWRFFQSGQFFYIFSITDDWRDESTIWPANDKWKSGTLLGIGDTIATFTEIFEFASRLALSEVGSEQMHVDIKIGNLQNRFLYSDSRKRLPLFERFQTSIQEYPYQTDKSRSELLSNSKEIALESAKDLFQRFRWNYPDIDILRSWQEEFRI